MPGARGGGEVLYLPTRALTLLDALCGALPAHTLLAADFDALPDTSLPGVNAPLVATTARCVSCLAPLGRLLRARLVCIARDWGAACWNAFLDRACLCLALHMHCHVPNHTVLRLRLRLSSNAH